MAQPTRILGANRRLVLNIVAVVVSLVVSVVALAFYLEYELSTSMRQSTELTFSAVYDAVTNEFEEVSDVCDSVRSNPFLIEALKKEADDPEGFHEKITDYLQSNAERYGFSTMYVVSDQSMRYYLPDGSVEVLDPEHDEWDNWYTALAESTDNYHVDLDIDKHNTSEWTIFVDWRIVDDEGNTLGVAGVGIDMDDVMKIARYYTKTFGMDVSFEGTDGTTYVGTDQASIAEAHRDVASTEDAPATTTEIDGGYRVSRYVPFIGWYLVVQNNSEMVLHSMFGLIGLAVVLMLLSLAVVLTLNSHLFSHERRELTHHATTDPLTGLLNRRGLEQEVKEYFSASHDTDKACLMAIDLDHFKEVNDTFGHAAGDQLLREVAAVLRQVFRESDILARPGGDEFTAFLPTMEAGSALERQANELCQRGRLSYKDDDGTEVGVTLSIGIALAPQNGTTFGELSQAADEALYEAKRAGRNCYRMA